MRRLLVPALVVLVSMLGLPAAQAHLERPSVFPDGTGSVPRYRTTGPALVVCASDSAARIRKLPANRRAYNEGLLPKCRFRSLQRAVDAAKNGSRILILPGVYREMEWRRFPTNDPRCADMKAENGAPTYAYHRKCPHDQNLVAILGDTNDDRKCDAKCNLQIEGTGAKPSDVLFDGDYAKLNVIRADRADGVYFRNFHVKNGDFNALYIIETDGFVISRMIGSHSTEYGFLTFMSDHGLYEHCEGYWNGDSGVYPGSAADHHGARPSIEIRYCNSHHNAIGYSGTAGNSVWAHHNTFHHNGAGITTDSIFPGHPGLPQDSARFEYNLIYSNNMDVYDAEHDEICTRPILERPENFACPAVVSPTGVGIAIVGGNDNLIANNWIWDNWRFGTMQFMIPAAVREEYDPLKQLDTSHRNKYLFNHMGMRPDGRPDRNGTDFYWDENGTGNCWENNDGGADGITADPMPISPLFPDCDDYPMPRLWPFKIAQILGCAAWTQAERDPPACMWVNTPPEDPGDA